MKNLHFLQQSERKWKRVGMEIASPFPTPVLGFISIYFFHFFCFKFIFRFCFSSSVGNKAEQTPVLIIFNPQTPAPIQSPHSDHSFNSPQPKTQRLFSRGLKKETSPNPLFFSFNFFYLFLLFFWLISSSPQNLSAFSFRFPAGFSEAEVNGWKTRRRPNSRFYQIDVTRRDFWG